MTSEPADTGSDRMRILCVIPVRGGSKGLPRKNAAPLVDGVSLLEWTIRQALAAYPPEDVVVSTEDDELADIGRRAGAQVVPRPAELARDDSTTGSVVDHLLETLDPDGTRFQAIAILQVTSPLRQTGDIRRSIEMISSGKYDSVVSAYETLTSHPAKIYFLDGDMAQPVMPEQQYARRQDLPPAYRRNGAIFLVTRTYYEQTDRLWGGRTGLVVMPEARSLDIDAPADLEAARRFLTDRHMDRMEDEECR